MLKHYLVLSVKVLLRRKFFTFVSIFGISVTLLVLMVVAAVLDHAFAPMPPETHQGRMLTAAHAELWGPSHVTCCSPGFQLFDQYARNLPGAERLTIHSNNASVDAYVGGRKIESRLKRTDAEFWKVLDFTFVEGRPFSEQEVDEAAFVAVINRTTRTRFFGDGPAIGRMLDLGEQRFRVVGVVEDVSTLREVPSADVWAPHSTTRTSGYRTSLIGGYNATVLASDRAALPHIRDEFNARTSAMELPPGFTNIVAPFETRFDAFARASSFRLPVGNPRNPAPQGRQLMLAFGGLAFLFVLLPTVNLVNINVSRIMERTSEIGVRRAFGGSRRALVGQFLLENVVLTLAGGLVGLLLSVLVLRALNESGAIPYSQFTINARVFLYGQLMALSFGILSGVYPAWRMSRLHPVDALRGGERR